MKQKAFYKKPLFIIVALVLIVGFILGKVGIPEVKENTVAYSSLSVDEQTTFLKELIADNSLNWQVSQINSWVKSEFKYPEETNVQPNEPKFQVYQSATKQLMSTGKVISKNGFGVKSNYNYYILCEVVKEDSLKLLNIKISE